MKLAILGYGREGQAAYEYWKSNENDITIHDNNQSILLPKGVKGVLGPDAFYDLDKYDYDLIVRSPGVRVDSGSIKTPITTPTREFIKNCEADIIGVTGTKGKGTTSTLIYKILIAAGIESHLVGNIGTPALNELINIKSSDIVVYEMSSFQLYDTDVSPHIAVCLMVTEDHLDWHKDLKEYQLSKGNIFKYQKPQDIAIYYADNNISSDLAKSSKAKSIYSYGENSDVKIEDGWVIAFGKSVIEIDKIALPGEHNLQNVCAAITACWNYTQDIEAIKSVLTTFIGLPYHLEMIKEKDGVKYYNDSFSTNPTAALSAVKSFSEPKVLFLGGLDRGMNFEILISELKETNIRKIITFGQCGKRIADALKVGTIPYVTYEEDENFETIIRQGLVDAHPGDVVIFSPGCASFDMFTDYIDRGNHFNDIINSL